MNNILSSNYEVIKAFNNNVLLVSQNNKEKILFGKGIGFGVHPGAFISKNINIDKVFIIEHEANNYAFRELISTVDKELIGLCEEILCMICDELGEQLNEKIHISLIDHIAFTIKRLKTNDKIYNPFLVETEALYKKEFEIACKAIRILEKNLKITIPDDEIGFIALHIHSARNQGNLSNTVKYTFLSNTIVEFIEDSLNIEIDKQSLDYARFLTHVRFAIERIITNNFIKNELLDTIKKQYSSSYKLAKKIGEIIESELHKKVIEDELAYLAIHIERFKAPRNSLNK